jgi:hypothetical protein
MAMGMEMTPPRFVPLADMLRQNGFDWFSLRVIPWFQVDRRMGYPLRSEAPRFMRLMCANDCGPRSA